MVAIFVMVGHADVAYNVDATASGAHDAHVLASDVYECALVTMPSDAMLMPLAGV